MLQVVKSLNTSLGRINPNQNWASQAFSTTIAIAYSAIASVAAVAEASAIASRIENHDVAVDRFSKKNIRELTKNWKIMTKQL